MMLPIAVPLSLLPHNFSLPTEGRKNLPVFVNTRKLSAVVALKL